MKYDVLIVGAGPAGLAAATRVAQGGAKVLVLEREQGAGGIPRHCLHQGFGLRDLHIARSGPRYAELRTALALEAGAELRTGADVTGWSDLRELEVTSAAGRERLAADAIVLATGCRERPRPARLIPGDRCAGVMTTGTLQQLVAAGRPVGSRAVVIGAEHVSYSALATLHHAGVSVAAMATELDRPQTFGAFRIGAAAAFGVRARTGTRLSAIEGDERVACVELTDSRGRATRVPCDTVVLTADWIPEGELAASGALESARATGGPAADGLGRTSRTGVFAAGNVMHGAEPADVAALEGRDVGGAVLDYLAARRWPAQRLPVAVRAPLRWASPTLYAPDASGRLLLRADARLLLALVAVRQGGRLLSLTRLARLAPGRAAMLAPGWGDGADPDGGPLTVEVAAARTRRQPASSNITSST